MRISQRKDNKNYIQTNHISHNFTKNIALSLSFPYIRKGDDSIDVR